MPNTKNFAEIDGTQKPYIYQLAYCSVLTAALPVADRQNLVAKAQQYNLAAGITGLLMMDQSVVVQWLEGDKAAVRKLWGSLQRDTRHHCLVELLHREYQETRLYPNWSMHHATRQEMLEIIHQARDQANYGIPNPWEPAIAKLCELIDAESV
jgi:Sensors of blue-light using FAD